jgi:hypothetical protein
MDDSGSQKTREDEDPKNDSEYLEYLDCRERNLEEIDIAELSEFPLEAILPYDVSAHDLPERLSKPEVEDLPEKFNVPQRYWIQSGSAKKFFNEPFPAFDLDHALDGSIQFPDLSTFTNESVMKRIIPDYEPIIEDHSYEKIDQIRSELGQAYKFTGIHLVDALKKLDPVKRDFERRSIKETIITTHNHMIECLGSLANSDSNAKDDALEILLDLARNATSALEALFEMSPEKVTAIAQEEVSWPVNCGPRDHEKKECLDYIDQIKLGTKKIENLQKRGPDQSNVMTRTAIALIKYIEKFRETNQVHWSDVAYTNFEKRIRFRPFEEVYPFPSELGDQMKKLPPLSSDTHEAWAEVCIDLLNYATGEEPQKTKTLSNYRPGTSRRLQKDRKLDANHPSVIKDRKKQIKKGLKGTMESIASHYVSKKIVDHFISKM